VVILSTQNRSQLADELAMLTESLTREDTKTTTRREYSEEILQVHSAFK